MPVSPHAHATRRAFRAWAILTLAFLYLPIVFLVLFSFQDSRTPGFPFTGFSLRWYATAFADAPLIKSVVNSVVVAGLVAVFATLIGTMAAFGLVRAGVRFPNAIRILVTMPIMFPGILIGVALLIFLTDAFHVRLSLLTVLLGHLVFTTPFVVLIVAARLQSLDRRLEWAAADLGAGPVRTLRHVVLPLLAPAIAGGALIAVTLSIDEFIVTFFLTGNQPTLPMYIYTQIKFGVTPEVNAVATLLLLATVTALAVGALLVSGGRRLRRRPAPAATRGAA